MAQMGLMKHAILILSLLIGTAGAAQAACYADYKAKRDNPLRLHYGVAEISGPCTNANAAQQLRPRLDEAGWELLNVVSTFDEAGLAEREDSAGENYLRY